MLSQRKKFDSFGDQDLFFPRQKTHVVYKIEIITQLVTLTGKELFLYFLTTV